MKLRYIFFLLLFLVNSYPLFAQDKARLSFKVTPANEIIIVTQADCHSQYGLAYPITYQLDFPSGLSGLKVLEKHQTIEAWVQIPEKLSGDLFNAIEAVRFDYTIQRAYVSAAFTSTSDSLFLKIVNGVGNPTSVVYQGISKYYDNRKAVVTISSDDWADWTANTISPLMHMFRSRGLYLTTGIMTQSCSPTTWYALQQELDSGYVEAASHSQTHPYTPYVDAAGEVEGSAQDIKHSLSLPPLFSRNGTGYVYTWIAPYGQYDLTIDSLVGTSSYLAARLYTNLDTTSPRIYVYGDSTLTTWNAYSNHFEPFLPTVEIGAPSWGGGDTSLTSLNALFDDILAKGDVYHMMWHPQVIYDDRNKRYLVNHLNYISGHTDVWYVNLGHLYLYHFIQGTNGETTISVASKKGIVGSFKLSQNYPNPFNPATTISFRLPSKSFVSLKVFDALGREVSILLADELPAGNYSRQWNAATLASGVYFYRLQAGSFNETKKLILLK